MCATDPGDCKKMKKDLDTDGMSLMQSVHWMENRLLYRGPGSQAVNIATTRATSHWFFWL